MERAVSPSPTSTPTAWKSSVRKSSAYRLFPIVEPTLPPTPVTPHTTLTKAAGSSRPTSSSRETTNHARDSTSTTGSTRPKTRALERTKGNGDGSDRGIVGGGIDKASSGSPDLLPCPHPAVDRAFDASCTSMKHRHLALSKQIQDVCYGPLAPVQEKSLPSSLPATRVRSRPRPNLTIRVDRDGQQDHDNHNDRTLPPPPNAPPPPPPRSPSRHLDRVAQSPPVPPKRDSHSPIKSKLDSDLPRTPDRSVAFHQSHVPLSAGLKVHEVAVSPGSNSIRVHHSQQPERAMPLSLPPKDLLEKPLPPGHQASLHPPASKNSVSTSAPSTSDGGRNSGTASSNGSVSPQTQRKELVSPRSTEQLSQPRRITLRSRLLFGSRGRTTPEPEVMRNRPASPETVRRTPEADWPDLHDPTPHYSRRAITPEPSLGHTDQGRLSAPSDVARPASAQSSYADAPRFDNRQSRINLESAAASMGPPPSAALSAARANVAALRNSGSSTGSTAGTERSSRSSRPDLAGLRRVRSDFLLRRPSSPSQPDAIDILKELSEESESLHARYAMLRAERQKLSSRIIATLRDEVPSAEQANMLLDSQLSLAALTSSMDICFAKLKSLDCRKEDAIAQLIAKTTQSQRSPPDNIAAMIASMAVPRKTSMALSLTGRSTPEIGDNKSINRLTQPSMRTVSYGSEPESFDHRYSSQSRKYSYGSDIVLRPDSLERAGPETIPEVVESPRSKDWQHSQQHRPKSEHRSNCEHLPALGDGKLIAGCIPEASSDRPQDVTIAVKRASEADSEVDLELIDHYAKRIRVTGKKAAKILGLLAESANSSLAPSVNTAEDNERTTPNKQTQVDSGVLFATKADDDTAASSHSFRTDDSEFDSEKLASSDVHDLEDQLKSFPKPNAPLEPTPDHRRYTGGSSLTNGSSADSFSEPEPVPPRPRRGTKKAASAVVRKRDPSAHPIQLHLDRDVHHEEFLEYYRELRHDLDSGHC